MDSLKSRISSEPPRVRRHQATFYWKRSLERDKKIEYYKPGCQVIHEFYIPIMIVSGKLYEAHLVGNDIEVRKASWIPVKKGSDLLN